MRKNVSGGIDASMPSQKLDSLIFVLIVMMVASVAVMLLQNQRTLSHISDIRTETALEDLAEEAKMKVSLLAEMPDERPLLATVDDAEKISSREMFKNVMKGDKVLVFPRTRHILIYRDTEENIIYFGPMN